MSQYNTPRVLTDKEKKDRDYRFKLLESFKKAEKSYNSRLQTIGKSNFSKSK